MDRADKIRVSAHHIKILVLDKNSAPIQSTKLLSLELLCDTLIELIATLLNLGFFFMRTIRYPISSQYII